MDEQQTTPKQKELERSDFEVWLAELPDAELDGLIAALEDRSFSPSCLDVLTKCEYRWARKYVGVKEEPEPRRPDDPAEAGSALHEAIETTLKSWVEGGTPVLEPMPLRVRDLFDAWRERFEFDRSKWYLVEETTRGQIGPFKTQSRADLIYADGLTLCIDDWKSSRAMCDADELRYELQPIMNALNVFMDERFAAFDSVKFSNVFVRYRNARRTTIYYRSEVPKLIDAVLFWISLAIKCLAARRFEATPGRHCANADGLPVCEFYAECPRTVNKSMIFFFCETESHVQEVADAWFTADKERALAKETIRAWVERSGAFTHNGVTWDFHPTIDKSCELSDVPKALIPQVLDHARVDCTKTGKRSVLKNPGLAKELTDAGAIRETASCEFRAKKVKQSG